MIEFTREHTEKELKSISVNFVLEFNGKDLIAKLPDYKFIKTEIEMLD